LNIKLQIFDATGAPLGNEILVNDTALEVPDSTQFTPAVALDDLGNIICVWSGRNYFGNCTGPSGHIFGRRLFWDRDPSTNIVTAGPVFFVDSDEDSRPLDESGFVETVNPTVSIIPSSDPALRGRSIVAFNAVPEPFGAHEIHAQYFDVRGRPLGPEFRVNQEAGLGGDDIPRRLANSAQHTVSYAADESVLVTWTRFENNNETVHFTRLPPGYAETLCGEATCLKGDANNDLAVDIDDTVDFVDALLFGVTEPGACPGEIVFDHCRFDMNGDCLVNGLDIQCFVDTVLGRACTEPLRMIDCNSNEVEDAEDIALGTSFDVNSNGIPDECEADCNGNDTPDDWDIAQHTSVDCDASGRPDECESDCNGNGVNDACDVDPADPDGNGLVSADCNASGIPDECEQDCNSNGVPDDCDVDPADPDGDEFVSADCNSNGLPDECDLALPPPFGSLDCNTNGIPDECDIASCESDPSCDDCNENGIPDGCDIAAQISEDTNSNGIPDECESQQAQGGGGEVLSEDTGESPVPQESTGGGDETTGGTPMPQESTGESPVPQEAAWAEFYDWCLTQDWGPAASIPTDQQFANMVAKLHELGLPLINPAIAALSP
jgi:hypothetical protein